MALGAWQGIELNILDRLINLRGTQANKDITLVTIDDQDINKFPTYPIADEYLAQVLQNIADANPSAIGLDIYRDLPQEPGHQELLETYQNIPQLFGVEKIDRTNPVNPPPALKDDGRIGFADLLIDPDNIVRRSVWNVEDRGELKFSLGAIVALQHLANSTLINGSLEPAMENDESVPIVQNEQDPYKYTIGGNAFNNIKPSTGGYWRKEVVGAQKVISYRHDTKDFKAISFYDVYQGRFNPNSLTNKIVLIGVTADSKKDFVYSPLSSKSNQARLMPGVVVHANIAAEFINTAKGIKPIQINNKLWEIAYVITWSLIGISIGIIWLELSLKYQHQKTILTILQYLLLATAISIVSTISFLTLGYWIPTLPAIAAALGSTAVVNFGQKSALKHALYIDKESQLVKRSYFEKQFDRMLEEAHIYETNIGLIICQIENWSKIKNRLGKNSQQYLTELGKIAKKTVSNRNSLVSRFTSDTLGIIIENTNPVELNEIADDIKRSIKVNKTLVKYGVPKLDFAHSLSDKIKNNSLSLMAEADQKLAENS